MWCGRRVCLQDLQCLDAGQLLVTLARRNEQLTRAETCVAQLQEQLQQQQSQADAAQDAARSRQVAAEARAAKQQEECMKQVIQLEYTCNKLEQEKAAATKQLQELQGVLLALEGASSATASARHQHHNRPQPSTTAAGQQPASSAEPVHLHMEGLGGLSQGGSQKENDPAAANPQQAAAADDWHADAAAAVGPGSLLHRPAHIVQAPSFVKPGVGVAPCPRTSVHECLVRAAVQVSCTGDRADCVAEPTGACRLQLAVARGCV